ncbi:hypothetical protein DES53_11670 [Roseimicrobium gellanilyticum]|uniref:Uncharacterized protein n=1 Tax=Roseimicrobium gellanilyticum TaxID=748857 RepID=A0A366H3R0_9BACT|nr:hypothetical protein [Roseimicrobium gellanilyticum]RBP36631.1 hypothetical protein DES53_11670 [Roseimicrobium gellanilyticum]
MLKISVNRATAPILLLGVALALGVVAILKWKRGNDPEAARPAKEKPVPQPGAPKSAHVAEPPREESSSAARALLAEFALTQDEALLRKAQELYPGDPRVILVSCLEAKTPDSHYLTLLETLEPENPLPNLMRAGMYASAKELDQFADELEQLVEKEPIFNDVQERRMDMLDALESQGGVEITGDQVAHFDTNYLVKLNASIDFLMKTRDLYGDNESRTDEVASKFAKLLRGSREFDLLYQSRAGLIEYTILHRQGTRAGAEAQSVERKAQMEQIMAEVSRRLDAGSKLSPLVFDPKSDPGLRREFFVRLSQEGESAAVEWLLKGRGR